MCAHATCAARSTESVALQSRSSSPAVDDTVLRYRKVFCICPLQQYSDPLDQKRTESYYCFISGGGPLIRFHLRLTLTSTRSATLIKGMPLFIP